MRPVFFLLLIATLTLVGCSDKRLAGSVASEAEILSRSGMSSEEIEIFQATNNQRLANGLTVLKPNAVCVRMAQEHAFDMVRRGYFSHDSSNETYSERVARYGLSGNWVGENIARGSEEAHVIMDMWMNSSGHRANILSPNFQSLGVGRYQDHWVQCFSGFPGDS